MNEDMLKKIEIRESLPSDIISIEKLYPEAFPDEDLLPLVRELLKEEAFVLSLVGIIGGTLVGHVIVTGCSIVGRTEKVALLGPLAIAPSWQQQGIGRTIVRAGLQRLENAGVVQVYVLGDPAYYGHLGFAPEVGVKPPYPLLEEWHGAWQSISLRSVGPPHNGTLSIPEPWCQPALWAP